MDKIYKPKFEKIDTRRKIEILLTDMSPLEKILLLESISKKYRRANSKKLNKDQMNYRIGIDDRPDEIDLK